MNLNTNSTTLGFDTDTVNQIEIDTTYGYTPPPERIVQLTQSTKALLEEIEDELRANNGKLTPQFIDEYSKDCKFEYGKIGEVRFCTLATTNGTMLTGQAIVLDPKNDIAEFGNKVAREKAINGLWAFLGGLAKMIEI